MKTPDWKQRKVVSEKNKDRYKKVRFTEKTKLERKIRQLRETLVQLIQSNQPTEETESELNNRLHDLQYVLRFPLDEKYISLFPKEPLSETALAQQTKIRDKIKLRDERRADLESRQLAAKSKSKATDAFFADTEKISTPKVTATAKGGTLKGATPKGTTLKGAIAKTPAPQGRPQGGPRGGPQGAGAERAGARPVPAPRPGLSTQRAQAAGRPAAAAAAAHPSWTAKADPRVRGVLVQEAGANKRVTFDSDEE